MTRERTFARPRSTGRSIISGMDDQILLEGKPSRRRPIGNADNEPTPPLTGRLVLRCGSARSSPVNLSIGVCPRRLAVSPRVSASRSVGRLSSRRATSEPCRRLPGADMTVTRAHLDRWTNPKIPRTPRPRERALWVRIHVWGHTPSFVRFTWAATRRSSTSQRARIGSRPPWLLERPASGSRAWWRRRYVSQTNGAFPS